MRIRFSSPSYLVPWHKPTQFCRLVICDRFLQFSLGSLAVVIAMWGGDPEVRVVAHSPRVATVSATHVPEKTTSHPLLLLLLRPPRCCCCLLLPCPVVSCLCPVLFHSPLPFLASSCPPIPLSRPSVILSLPLFTSFPFTVPIVTLVPT